MKAAMNPKRCGPVDVVALVSLIVLGSCQAEVEGCAGGAEKRVAVPSSAALQPRKVYLGDL